MEYAKLSDRELYELKAKQDILDTMADYWWYMDTKQWDRWEDCFTEEMAVFLMGEDFGIETRTQWRETNAEMLEEKYTAHQGHQSRILFTSPTTATGRFILNDNLTDFGTNEVIMRGFGYYIDDFEKGDDGKWRIKTLRLGYFRQENPALLGNATFALDYESTAVS